MSKEEDRPRGSILRFLDAAAIGAAVALTAYLWAFYAIRDHPNYRGAEMAARMYLDHIQEAIEAHRQATGRLPATLAELEDLKSHDLLDANGQVVDPWRHPYQYRAEGEGYILCSFGRDGSAGGEGLDADVYPSSAGRRLPSPTLRQFTFSMPTEGIRTTCILAGVCVALACIAPSRRRRGVGYLVRVGATAVGALLIAGFLSALHIPSGH